MSRVEEKPGGGPNRQASACKVAGTPAAVGY
jgi:hypothetical protein